MYSMYNKKSYIQSKNFANILIYKIILYLFTIYSVNDMYMQAYPPICRMHMMVKLITELCPHTFH